MRMMMSLRPLSNAMFMKGTTIPEQQLWAAIHQLEDRVKALEAQLAAPAAPTFITGKFMEDLKNNPAYSHIDLELELARMDAWLSVNPRRKKTKRFIVNWLNKIERPLPHNAFEDTADTLTWTKHVS